MREKGTCRDVSMSPISNVVLGSSECVICTLFYNARTMPNDKFVFEKRLQNQRLLASTRFGNNPKPSSGRLYLTENWNHHVLSETDQFIGYYILAVVLPIIRSNSGTQTQEPRARCAHCFGCLSFEPLGVCSLLPLLPFPPLFFFLRFAVSVSNLAVVSLLKLLTPTAAAVDGVAEEDFCLLLFVVSVMVDDPSSSSRIFSN